MQVENELHTSDKAYVDYCGKLAEDTDVPIAWGMCNGASADNTINTCNGGDCTKFIEENGQNGRVLIDQPALWTENWMGWFDSWGGSPAGDWPTFEATGQSQSKASDSHLGLSRAPYVLYGVKYIDLVPLASHTHLGVWHLPLGRPRWLTRQLLQLGRREPLRAQCRELDGVSQCSPCDQTRAVFG